MAVIGINYTGGNSYDDDDKLIESPVIYESVYLFLGKSNELLFNTGNFPKDWYDAKKTFLNSENEFALSQSSTVDQFIMDGAPYDSAYLMFQDDTVPPHLVYEYNQKGWEMFVNKGERPTWEELKESFKKEFNGTEYI